MPTLHGLGTDVLRALAWLMLLGAVFVPLERLCAERRQNVLRRQIGTDLMHYFLNSVVTVAAVSSVLAVMGVLIYRAQPDRFHVLMAQMPLWARIPATLAVGEIGFYWAHRWSHEIPLLWRFHAVHHSAEEVDWLTNTRSHPFDIVFPRLCGYALIFAAGLASTDASAAGAVVPLIAVFTTVWGFFIHANVKWRLGWLEWVVATPAFHRWHHVTGEHQDMNYAAMLPVFDWMFGTLYLPRRAMPPRYGSDTPVAPDWLGQVTGPFLPPAPRAAASGQQNFAPSVTERP